MASSIDKVPLNVFEIRKISTYVYSLIVKQLTALFIIYAAFPENWIWKKDSQKFYHTVCHLIYWLMLENIVRSMK